MAWEGRERKRKGKRKKEKDEKVQLFEWKNAPLCESLLPFWNNIIYGRGDIPIYLLKYIYVHIKWNYDKETKKIRKEKD